VLGWAAGNLSTNGVSIVISVALLGVLVGLGLKIPRRTRPRAPVTIAATTPVDSPGVAPSARRATLLRRVGGPLAVAIAVIVLAAFALEPLLVRQSNCGGNSRVLSHCKQIAFAASLGISESPDHGFRFTDPGLDNLDWVFRTAAESTAYYRARYLMTTNRLDATHLDHPVIVVVCDTPFRNVPERWIGKAPPTHAVGYSDGSTRLISTSDFARMDRSTFQPLETLLRANSNTVARAIPAGR
jgi:hypothetical protein